MVKFLSIRKYFTFFVLLLISYNIHAQDTYKIHGTVKDTVNYSFTQYTSISLLRASDSILLSFTRADDKGYFSVSAPGNGNYLMLYENPRFASVVHKIAITKPTTDVGVIPLIPRSVLLQEVVINGRQAITIKGDTIEYAADSFQTGQYDNVDALLRQLPGLEVNSDGSIKAYGQTVEKMLVDGDEFFSDDPAMVAKMLRASAVDAVQVYDKKSDEAEFTGIDDGQRIKTINLKLKANAKRGYFGKIMSGAGKGNRDYWQNEAMINAFKGRRKLSVYGIMSNTQTGGLSWDESRKYNSSSGNGVIYYSGGGGNGYDNNGNYSGQGLPKTWNAGAHYNNSWKGDSLKVNSSYSLRKNNITTLNNNTTQYILPDTQYLNNAYSERANTQMNHSLNFNGEYQIDTFSRFEIRANGGISDNNNSSSNHSEALSFKGDTINSNQQFQTNSGKNQNLNAYLSYRRKFRKKGRSFSAGVSENWNHSHSSGIMQSEYHLYAIDSTKKIDQLKLNTNQNQSLGLSLNYTEPIAKNFYLLFNYKLTAGNQESQIQSFNKAAEETKYTEPDSLYSNHYIYQTLANSGGMQLQYNPKDKINVTIGGNISNTNYTQKDLIGDSAIRYSYLNFFPRVTVRFRKSMQSSLYFNYNGRSQQPSISQLQPVRNNEDPLNVAIGNPDLKQAFHHDFRLSYYDYKVLTSQNIFLSANFSIEQNAITQKQTIDPFGKRTYQYVNVDGNYNAGFNSQYGRRIFTHLRGNIGANFNYSRTHNFINNQANSNNTWNISPGLRLNYNLDTTLYLNYSFSPSYNSTVSAIRTDIKTKYWNFGQSLNASLQLPFQFKIGSDIEWQIRQQLSAGDNHNKVFIWNAWVSRSFLKDHSLELKAYANDLLNQNVGYSRVTNANQISETNYNTIQRYFMISLTWNFTKMGGTNAAEQQ